MPAALPKPRPRIVALTLILLALMFGTAMPTSALPSVSSTFTYQGQITIAAGPVDGFCDLTLGL